MPDDATFPAGKQHRGREAIGFAGARRKLGPFAPARGSRSSGGNRGSRMRSGPLSREMFGAVAAGGAVRTAQPITEECWWFTCMAGEHQSQLPVLGSGPPRRADGAAGSALAFSSAANGARAAIQQRGTSDPPPLVSAVLPRAYPRYLALPSTTPECDSLLAWHSRGANPCSSHHAFASSAVVNRWFMTVTQNWPS